MELCFTGFDFADGGGETGLRGIIPFGYGDVGIHAGLLAQQNGRGQHGVASDFCIIAQHRAELGTPGVDFLAVHVHQDAREEQQSRLSAGDRNSRLASA